jgi:hypothetical protein
LEWARKQFEPLQPLPTLRNGWAALATLALEVAMNAACCWSRNIDGVPLREAEGFARRIYYDELKPTGWAKNPRITERPMWIVELKSGLCFLAPDWFWLTRHNAPITPDFRGVADLHGAASRAVSEHIISILVELSCDKNALSGELPILVKSLAGVSPRQEPLEPVGQWVQRLTKLAMEAYDRLDTDTCKRFVCWLPQFTPFPLGG